MIEFQQVRKRYANGHEALANINFTVERGEMAFVTGRSGAGKSTMLKLLALIERPSDGEIIVNSHQLNKITPRQIPSYRRGVGVIFQDHKLLNDRTVFDNVALPLVIAGAPYREINRRVQAALSKVDLLSKLRQNPGSLSTGEQQRVGIARAVVNKPPLILADEPTGNLDPELSLEVMRLFANFNRIGATVLIVSHDQLLVDQLGQRRLMLHEGRIKNAPMVRTAGGLPPGVTPAMPSAYGRSSGHNPRTTR